MKLPVKINHDLLYFTGFLLLATSMPLSNFGMSVSQFILAGTWLLEGNILQKLKKFAGNRAAVVLASLYLLHLIGLIYTSNFEYAAKDLRIKLPLLIFPLILSTVKPLTEKRFNIVLGVFSAAVFTGTIISTWIYFSKDISDFRDISPFISHIRFSLNTVLAIFAIGYLAFDKGKKFITGKIISVLIIAWLIMFLVLIESVTGLVILFVIFIILGIKQVLRNNNVLYRVSVLFLLTALPLIMYLYLQNIVVSYMTPNREELKNPDKYTANGTKYYFDTINYPVENGSYIGAYLCNKEMRKEWNKRSRYDYDGKDEKGQLIMGTIYRYLNSKGLRKDSAGIASLDSTDIRAIEMGIANYHYTKKFSFKSRIYKLLWSYTTYKRGGNPAGHTMLQRIEFWKTALIIIKHNFWTGVGTGDIADSFKYYYKHYGTRLPEDLWVNRAHNQFVTMWATFGIFGFVWFLITLFYPPVKLKRFNDNMFLVFFITLLISMLTEDTIETQAGVTLFAFPFSFLLFMRK